MNTFLLPNLIMLRGVCKKETEKWLMTADTALHTLKEKTAELLQLFFMQKIIMILSIIYKGKNFPLYIFFKIIY